MRYTQRMGSSAVLNPAPGITLHLVVTDLGIRRLGFGEPTIPKGASEPSALLAEAARQLDEYFSGRRRQFDLPLDLVGTEFQQRVWKIVAAIPYGETVSYGKIAEELGDPRRRRAVGAAVGANPIPIIIPCHRVIGADGSLVGYGGGLRMKVWLLRHEHALLA